MTHTKRAGKVEQIQTVIEGERKREKVLTVTKEKGMETHKVPNFKCGRQVGKQVKLTTVSVAVW